MSKFQTYSQFLNEAATGFPRFYMLVQKIAFRDLEPEKKLGKLIGKTRDFLFKQTVVANDSALNLKFDKNVPVLNYTESNDIVEKMLKDGIIDKKCLFNDPEQSMIVSSKVKFHEVFRGDYIPKTVFTIEDAKKLKFPVIGKPAVGKSAKGIVKFDKPDDLESKGFDVFSEAIEIKKEYRCFCFRDEIIVINERIKIEDSKDFLKDKETTTEFYYKEVKYPEGEVKKLIRYCRLKVKLDVYSIDFAEDRNGKLWIIEMNSRTGMGVDKMSLIYEKIYEDFYGKKIPKELTKEIDSRKDEWEKANTEKAKAAGEKVNEAKFPTENVFGKKLTSRKAYREFLDFLKMNIGSSRWFLEKDFEKYVKQGWGEGAGVIMINYKDLDNMLAAPGRESDGEEFFHRLKSMFDKKYVITKRKALPHGWAYVELYDENERGSYLGRELGINECTVVAGEIEGSIFLAKNRDRSFTPDNKIIREKVDGVEIAYYSDQTGWVEGMNEHGIGFVFSQLTDRAPDENRFRPTYTVSDEPKDATKFEKFANKIKKVLAAKTAEEMIKRIKSSKKHGNFLVSDGEEAYQVESFKDKFVEKKVDLSVDKYIVKTNHGVMIPDAGHQHGSESYKRGISMIRKHQAESQLMGFSDFEDVLKRMRTQIFDPASPLNPYRTDDEEYTISQCLMDLKGKKLIFKNDPRTATDTVELEDKLAKNYTPKITIEITEYEH